MSAPDLVIVAPKQRGAERLAARAGLTPDRWVWCASHDLAEAWSRAAADRGVPLAVWRDEPAVSTDDDVTAAIVAAAVVLSEPAPPARRRRGRPPASPTSPPKVAPTPRPTPAPVVLAPPAPRPRLAAVDPLPRPLPATPAPGSRIPSLAERLEARRRAEREASPCS